MKRITLLMVIGTCALLVSKCIVLASERPTLPAPDGPYGVGRVSYALTDPSRAEPLAASPNARRKMMVYVWYPTDRKVVEGKATAPYLPGLDEVKSKISDGDISDMFRPATYVGPASLPTTEVVENGPMPHGKQKFPLLLFSHGWGNPTFLYTAVLQDLVSHGYVVAAIDHPYDTTYTRFPDGKVTLFAQERFNNAVAKPQGMNTYAKERVDVMAEDNRYALMQILKYADTRSLHAPSTGT